MDKLGGAIPDAASFTNSSKPTNKNVELIGTSIQKKPQQELATTAGSQGGLLAVGSYNGDLKIFEFATNVSDIRRTDSRSYPSRAINRVRFSPDGRSLIASVGWDLSLFPIEKYVDVVRTYEGHSDVIMGFCLDEQSSVYSYCQSSIRLWDLRAPRAYHVFYPKDPSTCIGVLSPKGVLVTGDAMGRLHNWNLRTRTAENSCEIGKAITTLAVSPDNSWICVGSCGGDIFEYKYRGQEFVLENAVNGSQLPMNERDYVVECAFPRTVGPAVVAYYGSIGEFAPNLINTTTDGRITELNNPTWFHPICRPQEKRITCCTVNDSSSVFYLGLSDGEVMSYYSDTDTKKTVAKIPGSQVMSVDYKKL